MENVDAVIVGAGPNGLVAANLLADAGWDVVVLEAAEAPGGAVRSGELIEPGFVNDLCSAFYPFVPVSPMAELGLEDHGLRWLRPPLVLAHPAEDGSCPVLAGEVSATAASLEALHAGDGRAWEAMHQQWRQIRRPVMRALLGPYPPIAASARLAVTLRRDVLRFARFVLLPVRRMAVESFGGDAAHRFLAATALHADYGLDASGGGVFGWLLLMLGQDHGWPVPEGGAGSITGALVGRLAARGGVVRCGARVESVVISDARAIGVRTASGEVRAGRAVVADVDAPALFRELVGFDRLPARFVDDIRRFQWDHATCKVDWNLDRPVPWSSPAACRAGTVHVVDDLDALTRQHAEVACGELPRQPFLLVGQQSMTDPTRQPAGAETAWAYTHVPHHIRADAAGEIDGGLTGDGLARFADRMEAEIERLAPGFRTSIRGRHVAGPAELQAHDSNLVGGAVSGGSSQLHQMLMFRPVPGSGRPTTPIAGLYLASASAHPGGAVHGAPGANAARVAKWQARRRRLR